jgi:hypothetical protein
MSAATTNANTHTARGLSAPLLVGGAFVLSTIANLCFQTADIVFTDSDPNRPEGPVESIVSISVVGVIGLAVAIAIALPLVGKPRAKAGAIVLGALALLSIPLFWSGAPAVLGASAAWLAGLTRGGQPSSGTARAFGIIGFVVAILASVAVFAGSLTALLS